MTLSTDTDISAGFASCREGDVLHSVWVCHEKPWLLLFLKECAPCGCFGAPFRRKCLRVKFCEIIKHRFVSKNYGIFSYKTQAREELGLLQICAFSFLTSLSVSFFLSRMTLAGSRSVVRRAHGFFIVL